MRKERPEEFENASNPEPKPDAWFHAKIEVKNGRVKVFVDNAAQPCLDVKKMSETTSGKVGLWFNGIASFANLKISALE